MSKIFPDVEEIAAKVKSKEMKSTDLVEECFERIKKIDPQLNSILTTVDFALDRAHSLDRASDRKGKLYGVPFVVKDNFCVRAVQTTAASKILGNFISPYTAHCIERLESEGAIVIGKTNMDEFAMGSSNENSAFGICRNPWNKDFVPGGSSGGSAAAVAAGLAPVGIGSDTGGSIRQPASFCGVVGIKPTYGLVSRYGMIAFASSLDQAGPLAKSVRDAALFLEVMVHKDGRDGTNIEKSMDWDLSLNSNFRVGIPKEYMSANLEPSVSKAMDKVFEKLTEKGCELVEIELPHTKYAIPVYYMVAASEASSNLSRYDGVRYGVRDIETDQGHGVNDLSEFYKLTRSRGFGEEVKRRILLGTFSLSAGYSDEYYLKACQVRRLIANDFTDGFKKCDFILGPVSSTPAFKIGEKTSDPLSMYYNDILTVPANLAGLPAMSLPVGLSAENRPVGLQIIAPSFEDAKMIKFAEQIESLIDFKGEPHVQ